MSDVKRFVCVRVLDDDGETFYPTHVRVVTEIDYDALSAENAALKARLAEMEKALDGIAPFVSKVTARLAEAEQEYQDARVVREQLEARLAEAEHVLRICANYPPSGMRPQDKKPFFSGFIPAEQRAAREYFAARTTDREGASHE